MNCWRRERDVGKECNLKLIFGIRRIYFGILKYDWLIIILRSDLFLVSLKIFLFSKWFLFRFCIKEGTVIFVENICERNLQNWMDKLVDSVMNINGHFP